jgi:hypothetical protein
MFPQAIFTRLFPSNSEKTFLIIFTMSLTPGGSPPVVLFHLGLCGAVFPATSPPGPAGVWPASGARSTATHAWSPSPSPSPSRNGVFLIYMFIWWAHCSTVIILVIFLPLLIACPSGWKPSLFQKRPRRHAQKLKLSLGILALECPKRSLLIVGCNLLPISGSNFAKCLTFRTSKLQLITLSRMVPSKDCTAASRTRFTHAQPRRHGPRSYLLCSSNSEHSRGKTLVFPRLRQFLVYKLSCQINFCK